MRLAKRPKLLDRELIPTSLMAGPHHPVEIAEARGEGENRKLEVAKAFLAMWGRITAAGKSASSAEKGRIVRSTFDSLGGAFIKVGQLLALRRDLFAPEFCAELADLHDRATAFPPEDSRRIIEKTYGRRLEEIFSEFDPVPVAAASIGQVHIARLRQGGYRVAVKVQRPDAPSNFARDLRLLQNILTPLRHVTAFQHMNWEDAIWELHDIVNEELDYRYEAAALRSFRRKLSKHPRVYVPKVFEEWCTPVVLVLEYIEGVFMTDLLHAMERDPVQVARWQRENDVDLDHVGRTLLHSLYRQMFEDHLFHGDLHPGNIILLRKSWICLIDFGTIGRLDVDFVDSFHGYMTAVATRDFTGAVRSMLSTTENLPDSGVQSLEADLLEAFRIWHRKTLVRELPHRMKSVQALSDELYPVVKKYHLNMNWSFLRMNRAFGTLDVAIQRLLPNIDHPQEMKRYQRKARQRAVRKARDVKSSTLRFLGDGMIIQQQEAALRAAASAADSKKMDQLTSLTYRQPLTKMEYLIHVLMRLVQAVVTLAGLALLLAWMSDNPRFGGKGFLNLSGTSIDDYLRHLPPFEWWEGLIVLVILANAFMIARGVIKRIDEGVTQ